MASAISEYLDKLLGNRYAYSDQDVWWRGQSSIKYPLVPSIFRNRDVDVPAKPALSDSYYKSLEISYNLKFRRKAVSMKNDCPDFQDYRAWLFLMQHYGLPTRLLDWSESVLVALFFSVNEIKHHDVDGVVYGLLPAQLNSIEYSDETVFYQNHARISHFFKNAFEGKGEDSDDKVAALLPDLLDIRQSMQHSVFTIHSGRRNLYNEPLSKKYLFRIEISSRKKREILEQLKILGISRSTIFPDLENLATEIKGLKFSNPRNQAGFEAKKENNRPKTDPANQHLTDSTGKIAQIT